MSQREYHLPEDQPRCPPSTDSDAGSSEDLAAVVARAQTGDLSAFATLFAQFNARICTYLIRLVGNEDIGRDLAQDTFLAAWRGLPEMRDIARFVPWLYRIATNKARAYVRHAQVVRWLSFGDVAPGEPHQPLSASGPEQHAGESELILLALAQLAPQHRTCLLLQLEGGFSQREIANLLDISEKTVSVNVSRAREHFRRAYLELEHDSSRLVNAEPDDSRKGSRT